MTPERLAELRQMLAAAHEELRQLCDGSKRWTMRVPPDLERDSDLVISRGLEVAESLLDAAERGARVEAAAREYRTHRLQIASGSTAQCFGDQPCPTAKALDAALAGGGK